MQRIQNTEVALKVAPTKYLISRSDGEKGCKQDRWHFTCYEMMQLITTLPCVKTHKSIQTGKEGAIIQVPKGSASCWRASQQQQRFTEDQ
ncbi:hypothetical protein ATANTOWER_000383 [Ataeniobius toweri]|uniref:Uncharacterized protein n=1 Tax=Ataeniobius toweri TaxID=208326 RepID=A0ABU7C6W1_9TELE|nr:hypothetical protein [Ataeniobius toweri]